MSGEFEKLHPEVRRMIVNSLGWTSGLRPVQAQAIEPLLAGQNAVILAPTAGGKTEAAFFPLMSRLLEERWEPLSILYVSPLKALLNNQHERLERLFRLVGHDVGVWHGDIAASDKDRMRKEPPSLILTTPESLEGMLISIRTSSARMFANLRAIVIDEVHAFAGDDRGWHLLGVIERIAQWAGRDIQRVGLSATVGNKEEIVDWLSRGSEHPRVTIDPPPVAVEPEVWLDWVASLSNAASMIAKLHPGERRLVFCDSRLLTEKLTRLLRQQGVKAHPIHGSLSAAERRQTERTFSEGQPGVIVSTSALELGIDIGDLDRVIQIDAPFSVASFLQRMGRTGRRPGKTPNMLMLGISDAGLLRGAAIIELWKRGWVDPARAPRDPFHVLGQQILARSLERPGEVLPQLRQAAQRFARISGCDDDGAAAELRFLLERDFLHSDGVRIGMGTAGEETFGHRHFMKLVSVFTTPPEFKVFWATRELGDVDQATFLDARAKQSGPLVILLSGRNWLVRDIDWKARRAYVEPLKHLGKSRWVGSGMPMSRELAEAHRSVLLGSPIPTSHFTQRAIEEMESIRMAHGFLQPRGTTVMRAEEHTTLWTFGGSHANRYLAAALRETAAEQTNADGLFVRIKTSAMMTDLERRLRRILEGDVTPTIDEDHPMLRGLKFQQLLPSPLLQRAAEARHFADGAQVISEFAPFHFTDLTAVSD